MSKIYKTTIVDTLPSEGEKDVIYLILEDGVFVAYVYIGTEFLRIGEEYEIATTSSDGLMSASDKTKLSLIGGTMEQNEDTVSLASGSAASVATIPLRTGRWILITLVYFPGNSGGGWRYTFISNTSTSGSRIDRMAEDNGANVGNTTYDSRIVTILDGGVNYYLYAQQNSGSTLSCKVIWKAISLGY